jgi:hypothetical protein
MSPLSLVVAIAPNELVFVMNNSTEEEGAEEFVFVQKVSIDRGFRCFACGEKHLYVVNQENKIERRSYSEPEVVKKACDSDLSGYDDKEFISVVEIDEGDIFVGHGRRLSVWR